MKFRGKQRLWLLALVGLLSLTGCSSPSKASHTTHQASSSVTASRRQTANQSHQKKQPYANWHTVKTVKLPILMYHSISAGNALRVPAPEFKAQMAYLKQHGYRTLTANQAVYALKHHRIPQQKIVWVTLDDSYKDSQTKAEPILNHNQQHATINFITGFTKKKNHLNLADAKKMKAAGSIDFQSHTVRHLDLDDLTYRVQLTELTSSKKWLDRSLHQKTQVICYPAGRNNAETSHAAKVAGYTYALTTNAGIATSDQPPYALTRQRVVPGMPIQTFAALLR